jgi:hypothetical protein
MTSVYGGPVPSTDPVAAAVDRLYVAFSGVRRPSVIEYCTCCFSADEERALLAPVALRQLSVDVLHPYAFDVLLTVGDIDDFRYFLPRILEVACTVGFNGPDLESLAGRLAEAHWLDWPAAEQVASAMSWSPFGLQPSQCSPANRMLTPSCAPSAMPTMT